MTSLGRALLILLSTVAFGCAGFDPPVEDLVFTEGEYRGFRIGQSKSEILAALRKRGFTNVLPSDVHMIMIQQPNRDEAEMVKDCDRWEVTEHVLAGSTQWRAWLTFRDGELSEIEAEEWMGERWIISQEDLLGCS